MSVIPLTIFFSLLLAGLFIALFAHDQRRFASPERDSLLPLADETPRPAQRNPGADPAPVPPPGAATAAAPAEDPYPESVYF